MKIGIDISQTAFRGSGVARYTEMLVGALLTRPANDYTFFFSSLRQRLPASLQAALRDHAVKNYRIPPTILEFIWNQIHTLPIEHIIGKQDLIITSDWTEPPADTPKITTIHDLVYAKFPQTTTQKTDISLDKLQVSPNIVATQKRRLEWVKRESRLIMCDSITTKKDAEEILGIEADRLRVVYPGVKPALDIQSHLPEFETKYSGKQFILAVGKLEPRKNLQRLIDAFTSVQTQLKDVELWVVGSQGWGEKVAHHSPAIKFLGYVSDAELSYLYRKALCFVMPSIYEGFGYPVVEAMQHGCPVAASNTSSLAEIVGDNGLQFDPYSVEDIAAALKKLTESESLRHQLRERGLKRAEDFSLVRFSKDLFSVISEAV